MSALNVEARRLPRPADFVSIFTFMPLYGAGSENKLATNIGVNIMFALCEVAGFGVFLVLDYFRRVGE